MPLGRNPKGVAEWAVGALGVILTLIGVVLIIGGGMLIAAGGSWYYLLAGLGLVASGVLIFRQELLGAWIYVGVFVATVLWALWEVGLDG